ncbi:MAG: hypothetical protein OER78_09100, partial [Nitrosopumilus sp.]|nr:hypothetical protein [Nitrosopumilus sp.]
MPKVAIFFFALLVSPILTDSYASIHIDLNNANDIQNSLDFNSDIVKINPDFFVENNYKRYLIFGTNLQDDYFLKTNSMYGIRSDAGFFYVSVLSDKSVSSLISQGYHVVEDFKLDFHLSDDD